MDLKHTKYTQTSKLAVTQKERNLERLYDKEFFTMVILGGVGPRADYWERKYSICTTDKY